MTKSPKEELTEIIKTWVFNQFTSRIEQKTTCVEDINEQAITLAQAILDAGYIHRSQVGGVDEEKIIEILGKEYIRNERLGMPPEPYTSIKYRQAKALATSNIIKLWEYMGDGVYIMFDGYGHWLHANSHDNPTDRIYLEPEVFKTMLTIMGLKVIREADSRED